MCNMRGVIQRDAISLHTYFYKEIISIPNVIYLCDSNRYFTILVLTTLNSSYINLYFSQFFFIF